MSSTTRLARAARERWFAQRYSALSSAGLLGSKTLSTVMWIARIVAPRLLELRARRAGARVAACGSCAATCAAASKAPMAPQRSNSRDTTASQRQRTGRARDLCAAPPSYAVLLPIELRERNRAGRRDRRRGLRTRDAREGLAPSGAARRARAETPRFSAPRRARRSRSAARRGSRRRRRAARRDAASACCGRSAPRRSGRSRRRAARARDRSSRSAHSHSTSRPRSAAASAAALERHARNVERA